MVVSASASELAIGIFVGLVLYRLVKEAIDMGAAELWYRIHKRNDSDSEKILERVGEVV